ncbi:MAG: hypothetical protein J6H20_06600 [Pyramidobacter sp.]|nr:hypothetical protein [Pyramidobacter sp.]MBP3752275.1 hypothetical protein [Pyramidobacter sp.]
MIITIMDEFVDLDQSSRSRNMRGALSEYANPALAEKEQGAWERAVR